MLLSLGMDLEPAKMEAGFYAPRMGNAWPMVYSQREKSDPVTGAPQETLA